MNPPVSNKESHDQLMRDHYQKAASMSLLMSEEQMWEDLSPKRREAILKARQSRLSESETAAKGQARMV